MLTKQTSEEKFNYYVRNSMQFEKDVVHSSSWWIKDMPKKKKAVKMLS
jgi:hypothetical protein